MTDERPRARIVHGVCQVPHQDHLKAEPCHLPDAKRAVEDADVGVDAHERDVGDPFLFAEVVDLLAVVTDTVKTDDVDGRMLTLPGIRPCPFLHDRVVTTALGVIDGKAS
jgi:hypothetical protein